MGEGGGLVGGQGFNNPGAYDQLGDHGNMEIWKGFGKWDEE